MVGTGCHAKDLSEAQESSSCASENKNEEGKANEHEISILKSIRRIFKLISHSLFMSAVGSTAEAFVRMERQIQYHDRYEKRQKRRNLPENAKKILG